jgi:cytochrome c
LRKAVGSAQAPERQERQRAIIIARSVSVMRSYILTTCALTLLAACGGAGSSSAEAEGSDEIVVAQAETAPAAAAASGPDLSGLPAEYQAADLRNGRTQWFLCAACHMVADGSSHSVGPDLHGVFGNTAGTNATFPLYSPALKDSGMIWSAETINTWIENPRNVLPSTTMIFPGIRDADDRRDLIAYLWVESGGDAE